MANDDPFIDPRFPDRPQHQDYYRLMDAVAYLDGAATEGNQGVESITQGIVDVDSLTYMATHRARLASQVTGMPEELLAALWIDAFCVGAKFEQNGGTTTI